MPEKNRSDRNPSRSKKLMAYSTLAASALAFGMPANAKIVYTDIEDETIGIGQTLPLDINGDGHNDFRISLSADSSCSSYCDNYARMNPYYFSISSTIGYYSYYYYSFVYNGVMGNRGGGSNIAILEHGDTVSTYMPWLMYASSTYSAPLLGSFSTYSALPGGNWPGQTGYAGVKFYIDGRAHYGWVQLTVGDQAQNVTVQAHAYEDNADTFMKAGAGEPGDIDLNGTVELADAIKALKVAAGINAPADNVFKETDVNNDGTIGVQDAIYALQQVAGLHDRSIPDYFAFNAVEDAEPGHTYYSAQIMVNGINVAVPISIAGDATAKYKINHGDWTADPGTVHNNDDVQVRVTASNSPGTTVTATLNIGGIEEDFDVTTGIWPT